MDMTLDKDLERIDIHYGENRKNGECQYGRRSEENLLETEFGILASNVRVRSIY